MISINSSSTVSPTSHKQRLLAENSELKEFIKLTLNHLSPKSQSPSPVSIISNEQRHEDGNCNDKRKLVSGGNDNDILNLLEPKINNQSQSGIQLLQQKHNLESSNKENQTFCYKWLVEMIHEKDRMIKKLEIKRVKENARHETEVKFLLATFENIQEALNSGISLKQIKIGQKPQDLRITFNVNRFPQWNYENISPENLQNNKFLNLELIDLLSERDLRYLVKQFMTSLTISYSELNLETIRRFGKFIAKSRQFIDELHFIVRDCHVIKSSDWYRGRKIYNGERDDHLITMENCLAVLIEKITEAFEVEPNCEKYQ